MSFAIRLAAVALCCAAPLSFALAQMPTPAAGTPVMVDPAKSMDGVLSAVEKDIVALAEAMPADKYSFAPKNSDFTGGLTPNYAGVRTFGQEIAHIAAGNYLYIGFATGIKPTVDFDVVSKGVDKETALASLKASFAAMHRMVATLTVANAFEHQGRGPNDSRIGVIAGGLAHERDHYGQLVEYARMNGLTPPASAGRPPANPAKM